MDTNLRGMTLPTPRFRLAPLPKELCAVRGFNSLQTFFPALTKLYNLTKEETENIWLDSKWRISGIDISGTSGPCSLNLVLNQDVSGSDPESKVQAGYMKVTHLLDPIRWMKRKYSLPKQNGLPGHTKTWTSAWTKLQDSGNQAYVEAVASYALGRLREEGISPHFNEFYGAFCARADLYRYNLTEEFEDYKNTGWLWEGQKKGLFKICMLDKRNPDVPLSQDIIDDYLKEPSVIDSDSDSDASSVEEIDVDSDIEEEVEVEAVKISDEMASLHSDEMSAVSFNEESEDESDESDTSEPYDQYAIYSEFRDFPVMLIALEKNNGTMDSLLDSIEAVGAKHGTPEWELRWSAWIFQVIAGLIVAQNIFGFTHNDLHTNNIVWSETEDEFLYYTLKSGATFKVPTFGKIFRIIDFGRSIYTINGTQFISDDFGPGNDAEGQYSFKPLNDDPYTEVLPNPSFDLCRLAVSLFESLYPDPPEEIEGGEILSSEEGMEIRETVSPLFNCLWSWMIDDDGENVLLNADGSERFPDFDLYKHIAASIHVAVPSKQLTHPAFDQFQVNPSEVGNVRKWQLFI